MSRIKILNSSLVEQGIIQDVFSAARVEKLNSDNTLAFSVPLTASNTTLIAGGNVAEADDDYFDIVYYHKGQNSNGELSANVECEHVSYRLNDPDYDKEYFTEIGTPTVILGKILSGTGFSVGTVEFSTTVTYSAQEKKSRRQLLMEFVDYIGGEVEFNKFQVSIRQHRGSTTPKDLTAGRNLEVIYKVYNKREKDYNGNPLVSYGCKLIRPMQVALGDVVSLDYTTLDIDVELRVVSLTTNPYNQYEAEFEIGNFIPGLTDDAYRIATSTLGKGKTYYGARIGPDYGFESIRSDKKARGVFNADEFALQVGDGSGSSWTDKIYFDLASGTYVFDGLLSAGAIEAISAAIDIVISNTTVTQVLTAEMANIAQLTVDRLDTSQKVQKYLSSDTSDVNFIRIQGQTIEFITAIYAGGSEQAKDRYGANLYWTDETKTAATTTATEYPVRVYTYTEYVKMSLLFEHDGTNYIPKLILGTGTGSGNNGKGYIYKGTDGLYIEYLHSVTGQPMTIKLTDEGIDLSEFETITYAENVAIAGGMAQIWIQPDAPAAAKANDVWIDTDDYSRYDVMTLGAGVTLLAQDSEVIMASGTFTINLHSATSAGIIKKIYNVGAGIVTITGSINGASNMFLYPGESVELVTNGSDWRY